MVFRFPLLSKTPVATARPARQQDVAASGAPMTDEPVCLVGDIHGRIDLLDRFLRMRERHFPQARVIALGDMIDRGEDSAAVLTRLQDECTRGAVCLSGNHEGMLLAVLDDPVRNGPGWLAHGGMATIMSYGLRSIPRSAPELVDMADRLRAAIGAATLAWLRGLPLWWRSGNLVAAHAGLDPALPPEGQSPRTLTWGHPDFGQQPRADGLWVAHGHVVVDRATARRNILSLDTGAYATGRLSYAVIDPALAGPDRMTLGITP